MQSGDRSPAPRDLAGYRAKGVIRDEKTVVELAVPKATAKKSLFRASSCLKTVAFPLMT
jgi:hypothetical protein